MSGGEVAGLIVAVFWAILVAFLAVVLVRLAQALREATRLVAGVTDRTVPLLGEAAATVQAAGAQLERVDAITADVKEVTGHASALSATVSSAFGGPLVKVAAFGYGLRRAVVQQGSASRAPAPVAARRPARATRATLAGRVARAAITAAPRREPGRGTGRSTRRSKG